MTGFDADDSAWDVDVGPTVIMTACRIISELIKAAPLVNRLSVTRPTYRY